MNTRMCAEKKKVSYKDLGISGVYGMEIRKGLVLGTE